MTGPRHRASTARRPRHWLLPTVAAGLAVAVASMLSPLGTTAAWSDFAPFRDNAALNAGGPAFSVTGFEALHEFEYEVGTLTTDPATVVLENRGDVTLQHFEATARERLDEEGDGSESIYDNVSWKFAPENGNPATQGIDWDAWADELYDLILAPGQSASYEAATTLDLTGLDLTEGYAVIEITVLARIASSMSTDDAAWSIATGTGIVQSLHMDPGEIEVDVDTSNARWDGDLLHGHDLHLIWDTPPFGFGPAFTIYINGIAQNPGGDTWYYYSPRFQIGPARVMSTFQPGALKPTAPGVGEIITITVEVRASGTDWVARKTMWVQGVAGGSVLIYGIDPATPRGASAPAPLMAFAAPEAAQPAPAATAPAQEPEPAPVAPSEEDLTTPAEETSGESTAAVALDGMSPTALLESAMAGDEPVDVELVDDLWHVSLPERFWAGPRELVLTGVDEHGTPFALTIRLTREEHGEIGYELVEAQADEPPAEASEA